MKRIVLSALLMLGLLVSPAIAAAQPVDGETSYTSEFSGDIIDIGDSGLVQFQAEQYSNNEYTGGWEEFIWLEAGGSTFQVILVGGENTSEYYADVTMRNMEEFYDEWEIVEQDVDEEQGTFIGNASIDGVDLSVYYNFELDAYGDTDLVVMQFSWTGTFADDLQMVQDEVTVNGDPLLASVDGAEIEEVITGGTSSPVDDTGTPGEVVVDPVDLTDLEEGDGITFPQPGGDESATPDAGTDGDTGAVADGDWEAMGLISDSEWESPTFGNTITWDTNWLFPQDYDMAIIVSDDPVYDSLTLETVDGLGYVFINVEEVLDTTPVSQADYWNSPEYAERFEDRDFEIVEVSTTRDTATVIYQTVNNADQELYVVLTATFLDDETVIYSQISAAPDTIGDVYEQYADGIEVDGAPLDLTYTVDDIYEISGN